MILKIPGRAVINMKKGAMHERLEQRAKLSLESLLRDLSSDDEHSAQPRERECNMRWKRNYRYIREIKGCHSKLMEESITSHLYGGSKIAVSILLFGCWQNEFSTSLQCRRHINECSVG